MLLDLKKHIAYFCRQCEDMNISEVGIFDFSGRKKLRMPCMVCGEADCAAVEERNSKYKIDTYCPLCSCVHSFFVTKQRFWSSSYSSLCCPETGFEIFFHGDREKIEEWADEMYGEDDGEDEWDIADDILQYIRFMAEINLISCTCGNGDIKIIPDKDAVIIECMNCGRKKVIRTDGGNYDDLFTGAPIILI